MLATLEERFGRDDEARAAVMTEFEEKYVPEIHERIRKELQCSYGSKSRKILEEQEEELEKVGQQRMTHGCPSLRALSCGRAIGT
jgi:hypothetical protein